MSRLPRWVWRNFRGVAVVLSAAGVAAALWSDRAALSAFPWRLSWPLFVLAISLFCIGPLAGATSFWLIARDLTRTATYAATLRLWMRGFLARYVPFGAVTLAVRLRGRGRIDASRSQMLSSTAHEQIAAVLGGALAATLGLSLSGEMIAALPAAIGVLALGCVIAAPRVGRQLQRVPRLGRFRAEPVSRRSLAHAGVAVSAGWAASGTAVWVLFNAVSSDAPTLQLAAGAYALAWLIGFIVPFAPSGLGVREALFVGIMAPHFGVGPAAALAVVARFSNVVGDLIAAAGVEGATAALGRRGASLAANHA